MRWTPIQKSFIDVISIRNDTYASPMPLGFTKFLGLFDLSQQSHTECSLTFPFLKRSIASTLLSKWAKLGASEFYYGATWSYLHNPAHLLLSIWRVVPSSDSEVKQSRRLNFVLVTHCLTLTSCRNWSRNVERVPPAPSLSLPPHPYSPSSSSTLCRCSSLPLPLSLTARPYSASVLAFLRSRPSHSSVLLASLPTLNSTLI